MRRQRWSASRPWPPGAGFALEAVDQVDDIEEAAAGTGTDAGAGDANCQMSLAGSGAADQHQIALQRQEAAAGEIVHQGCVDRRVGEVELVNLFGEGSLAIVSWYFIELACFSLTRRRAGRR